MRGYTSTRPYGRAWRTLAMVILLLGGIAGVWAGRRGKGVAQAQTASTPGATTSAVQRGPGVREVPVPAAPGSGMYSLSAGPRGTAWLSWLEPAGEGGTALKFARFSQGAWMAAREMARGNNWFVNWADHPSIAAASDGTLMAHWLVNNDGRRGSYGYGIRIARSTDEGRSWSQVFSAGTDNRRDYSGFVTMLPTSRGFLAAYLTPQPSRGDSDHQMGVQVATFDSQGRVRSDVVTDADTCTCCSTTMVETAEGPLVAYRDHEAGEIRDISIVRFVGGRWTTPRRVANDGWRINACPTNGPALAAVGRQVTIAWFTAANDEPRVKVAFSSDAGATFSAPTVVDGGRPIGWPSAVLLDDGSMVVAWLESIGGGVGEIRVRRVRADGRMGPSVLVTTAPGGRSAGIPQMVRLGDGLLLAWRQDHVRSVVVPIPAG